MNAFTCSGPYAILIAYGLKNVENRTQVPYPRSGRCAMSVSKKFNYTEWLHFMAWAKGTLPPAIFLRLPPWEAVSMWPGKVIATMDYATTVGARPEEPWYEGYPVWWHLSRIKRLQTPIQCRGNIGMWVLPESVSKTVQETEMMGCNASSKDCASFSD